MIINPEYPPANAQVIFNRALNELIGRNPHGWPVKTVFCAVPLRVDSLKLVIMGGDNFPEGRRGRVPSAVELGLERMVFQRHRHIH
jgi:hypothetical protein